MGILPRQMGNHIYCGSGENKQGRVMELKQKPRESIKGPAEGRNTLNKQMGYREVIRHENRPFRLSRKNTKEEKKTSVSGSKRRWWGNTGERMKQDGNTG